MFASQLLRILQTIPDDGKYETCVFDRSERKNSMRRSQDAAFYHSESFGEKADSLTFGTKEINKSNCSRTNSSGALGLNHGNEYWNAEFLRLSMEKDARRTHSSGKEDPNRRLDQIKRVNGDSDSLYCETREQDKLARSSECEGLMTITESMQCNGNEIQDSVHPRISSSDSTELDSNLNSKDNEIDFDLPELKVCYKESGNQIVKDDLMNERFPADENKLTDDSDHEQSCLGSFQPPIDNSLCEATEEVLDQESFVSGVLTANSMDGACVNECWKKEETDGELLSQRRSKSPSDSSLAEDTAKESDPESSTQTDEAKVSITGTIASDDYSEEESFVVNALPVQPFGTRSFLRSFLNSLDFEEINIIPSSDENSFETSAESEQNEAVQARKVLYSSTIESKTITFNFNSHVPALSGKTKNFGSRDNLSETRRVDCPLTSKNSMKSEHGQSLSITCGNPIKFCVTSPAKTTLNGSKCKEKHHGQSPDDCSFTHLSSADDQPVQPHFLKHDPLNSVGSSAVSPPRYEEGETSFSAAHLISYSGSVPYSGSLSMRSDGSATSSRSFAFPILQSEWKSPIRMEETNTGHFHKHKHWRQGLFCCRC